MSVGPRLRVLTATIGLSLLLGIAGPATAATDDDPDAVLRRTEQELASATADLAGVEARLDAVEAEVEAADQQLAALSAQLALVEDDLEVAMAAVAAAEADLEAARARLARADAVLDEADARSRAARGALGDRAARMWMHGPAAEMTLVVGGITTARDLHDLAVVEHAAGRVLDHDRALLDDAEVSAAAAAVARSTRSAQRERVTAATSAAYLARDEASAIVAHQRQLVAEAEQHRATRRAALARIEQDAEARAALVARLTEQVEQLRADLLDDWLRAVEDLPTTGPTPDWAERLPSSGRPLAAAIDAAAAGAGLDGRLLAALVWTESAFQQTAVSPAGALGLTQLMPPTAAGLGVDPRDPLQNLAGGARYLRLQLDRFQRVDLALAAYNAGPGRVQQAGGRVPDIVETQLYVIRVLERWDQLR